MSLLTLVQQACYMLAIPPPSAVYGNTDDTALHLLALSNEEGRSLSERHNWQALTTEKTFTTVAAAAQTDSIASDFSRMIPETIFNRTSKRRVIGPVSSDEWQAAQASSTTYINPVFRIRGGTILIYPTPSAGDTVAYEYITTDWCSGGAAWTDDTDTGVLTESLMTLGLVWRFKMSRGMDYGPDRQIYEHRVRDAIVRDGSRPRLSADPAPSDYSPRAPSVPEANWDL
jgi:hypothetical protein